MPYPIRTSTINHKACIWDHIRKKYVLLTPEEWVRQNFIQFLVEKLDYPLGLIAVEKKIKINSLQKRYDIVVYKNTSPWMLVECKAESVPLHKDVLLQSLNYNQTIKAQFIVLTNLTNTYCLTLQGQDSVWLDTMPEYE